MARTIAFACKFGDATFAWEHQNDAIFAPIIQKLLDNKVPFHITRKGKKVSVTKITQAMDARKIVLPDSSLHNLFAAGVLMATGLVCGEATGEIARTVQDVIENDTVVTPQAAGG